MKTKHLLITLPVIDRAIIFVSITCAMLSTLISGCASSKNDEIAEAPTATSSSDLSTLDTCIVGIWEVENKNDFLQALVPVGSFDSSQLVLGNPVGGVAYRFDGSGYLTVEGAAFQGSIDVKDNTSLAKLEIRLNGFASGRYSTSDGSIHFSEMTNSDMTYNAIFDGEEMMADVKADSFLPLFVPPFNSAKIECSATSLSLSFENHPNINNPLIFKRLR